MNEGLHHHEEEQSLPPHVEREPEHIVSDAVFLPGTEPIVGMGHADITMNHLTAEQIELLSTLEGEDAEKAYCYKTSKNRYVYGNNAVKIAGGDRVIGEGQEIKTIDPSEFSRSVH